MKLTNEQIYNYANSLLQLFNNKDMLLPVRVNFYLQKNKSMLIDLARDIEELRASILKRYGEADDNGQFSFTPENANKAQQDLTELFSIEQEVPIYIVSIDIFTNDIVLTTAQMEALMFMIEP